MMGRSQGGRGGGWLTPARSAGPQAMPPSMRAQSTAAARAAEPPGLGQKGLHPVTAHLKLKPTGALTRLEPALYGSAGRLLGEHPVTAKVGHAPRDTMFAKGGQPSPAEFFPPLDFPGI
jgi:hypothetical protein